MCLFSVVWIICAAAQDRGPAQTIEIGKPVNSTIHAGEVHRYQLPARAGEFLRGSVLQDAISLRVRGLFPDGSKIRSFSGPQFGKKVFRFVAEGPGICEIELTAMSGGQTDGRYTITLEQVQPMAERLSISVPESYTSPRIRSTI